MSYTYGLAGERLTMTLPGGGVWTYGYLTGTGYTIVGSAGDLNSAANMLATITDDQGRQVEYHFDMAGAPHEIVSNQVYDVNLNRVGYQDTVTTYDGGLGNPSHRRPVSFSNTWNSYYSNAWHSTRLVQNDYTYDLAGQRLTNKITSADGSFRTEQYGYDEVNRLKTVNYGDGQTQSYLFDAMSNRTSKTDVGGGINGTEGYTFNAANMLLTRAGNSYTNDLNGNTLTGGGRTNTWDSQNRLVTCVNGANSSSFVYGADGLRRQSTVNGTVTDTVLDNSMCIREKNHATGAAIATYFIGARGPEARRDDVAGTIRWYLYDGLGSVLGEVDPTGTITSSRKYDVYGAVRSGVNPTGTSKHKFVGALGHPSEDETGLVYMRARYYDPMVGRFASEDPRGHGVNWFAYASANPVSRIDFDGHSDWAADISSIAFLLDQAYRAYQMLGGAEGAAALIEIMAKLRFLANMSQLWAGIELTEAEAEADFGVALGPGAATIEERLAAVKEGMAGESLAWGAAARIGARICEEMILILGESVP